MMSQSNLHSLRYCVTDNITNHVESVSHRIRQRITTCIHAKDQQDERFFSV